MAYTDAYLTSYSDAYGSVSRLDSYTPGYDGSYGTAFPAAPIDAQLALNLAAAGWTDITPYAQQRGSTTPIQITRGRPDESGQAVPATLAVTVDNRTGRFSPGNPLGPWYGQLARNTPLRCSVPSLEPHLRLEYDATSGASCPDAAPLDITGTIDARIDLNLSSYLPCVLASKWSLAGGSVTLGGTIVGSTNNDACYNSPTQIAGANTMDAIVGRPVATNAQKVYFSGGGPSTVQSDHQGLITAKCLLWLCYKPAVNGSDSAALQASINAYVAAAVAAGAPMPKVVLWQEPQNAKNNLTPATYKQCMTSYYSTIKALAGSPAVVYDSASHLGEAAVRSWYPGDALCDELAQDLYGYTWKKQGVTLTTLQSIANAASPQKPVSHAEMGTALSAATAAKMTQQDVKDFFAYVQGVFTARSAAGLPNSEVMWFNGLLGKDWNTITAGDFRIPLMRALYDALQPSSGGASSNQRSWALTLNGDGTLTLWWTTDGTLTTLHKATSTVPVPLGRVTLRAYAQPSGVTFWTAPGGSAASPGTSTPWAQLGGTITLTSLAIFSSTAPLQVGYNSAFTADQAGWGGPTGQVYGFQLRSYAGSYSNTYTDLYGAPTGGTPVADAGFTSQPAGATSFTDSAGNAWQLTGTAEIAQRSYRFHGEASNLPAKWDVTGTDIYVPLQAGGLLRRLSQGSQPPVASAFKRAVLNLAGALAPVAYWPMEDAASATQFGPAAGTAPMTFSTAPQLSSDTSFACSAALPVMNNSACTGPVAAYTGGTANVIRFLLKIPSGFAGADDTLLCRANTTGSIGDFTLRYKTGGQLRLTGYSSALGGYAFDTGALAQFSLTGATVLVSMELVAVAGGKLQYTIATLAAGQSTATSVTGTFTGTLGNVLFARPGASGLTGVVMGHLSVQSAQAAITTLASPLAAWAGETCANRFARLCGENGTAARIYGYPATDIAMGAQTPGTFTNLLQGCETTGRGLLFEPRQALGLGYRTVRSLCQQAPKVTADYSLAQLGEDSGTPLSPTLDDQFTVNDVTVSNATGASYRTTLADGSAMSVSPPPAGAGDYGNSYTVNAQADAQLQNTAGWILNIGTVNEVRYPVLPFGLSRPAAAPLFFALQETDIGDHLKVVNTPSFLPPGPVKQLAYGTRETLGGFYWALEFNCVPESPYETGLFADPVFGHMDTDGSVLDADLGTILADIYAGTYSDVYGPVTAVTAGSPATFTVDTTGPSGIPWTTNPADFPFDILAGGEQMTVTSIAGPPLNFLTGQNAGFEGGQGTWQAITNCTAAASAAQAHSGAASMAVTVTAGGSGFTVASCAAANIATQGLPASPGDLVTVSAWFLATGQGRIVTVGIDWYNSGGTFLSTSFATIAATDSTASWVQAAATLAAPAATAYARANLQSVGGFAGEVHYVDDVFLGDITAAGGVQQLFNVIRGVNGIVKAHSAGEAVKLAYPAIVALA